MSNLSPHPILSGFEKNWNGFQISEVTDYELVSLAVVDGEQSQFAKHFKRYFKADLPLPSKIVPAEGGSVMWLGLDQYFIMLDETNIDADKDIGSVFQDTAYPVLQSDGWAVLSLNGERMHDVLERFVPLDLRNAPKNFAARTSAHHISVIAAKLVDGGMLLLTPRSSAQSFLDALIHVADNVLN